MRIEFITSMAAYPWGGSEELWHGAVKALAASGWDAGVSYPAIRGWHSKLDELKAAGVEVNAYGLRNNRYGGWAAALFGKLSGMDISRPWPAPGSWRKADLVVVSQGGICDGLGWLETLARLDIPYAVIVQANTVAAWPSDPLAARLRAVYGAAKKVYFVAEDNLRLFRTQVAYEQDNVEVIWNPLNSSTPEHALAWPPSEDGELRLAMVGRIEPFAKGQDLALEAFAMDEIRSLPIKLSLFGEGPWSGTCQRLIDLWNLRNVNMRGHAIPANIWKGHHALLLTSRHEGTSLAMLETMWLGRPVISTAIAGALTEVVDGVNGFFIRDSSASAVADALHRCWMGRDSLETLGTQAARRLRERMPADPGATLANKLIAIASAG